MSAASIAAEVEGVGGSACQCSDLLSDVFQILIELATTGPNL